MPAKTIHLFSITMKASTKKKIHFNFKIIFCTKLKPVRDTNQPGIFNIILVNYSKIILVLEHLKTSY